MKKVLFIPLLKISVLVLIAGMMWQCSDSPAEEKEAGASEMEPAAVSETVPAANPGQAAKAVPATTSNLAKEIQWISWDEAVAANEQSPKLLFIDLYTDWCGWCKVMDKKTFTDPKVIEYINAHYYAIKFNAEKEDPITFRGQKFEVVEAGRRGIHTLAYNLLEGQLSYPSYVYLNSDFQRFNITKGFKPAEPFLSEMKAVTEAYTQTQ